MCRRGNSGCAPEYTTKFRIELERWRFRWRLSSLGRDDVCADTAESLGNLHAALTLDQLICIRRVRSAIASHLKIADAMQAIARALSGDIDCTLPVAWTNPACEFLTLERSGNVRLQREAGDRHMPFHGIPAATFFACPGLADGRHCEVLR